jgi:hypothetical protein
MEVPLTPRLTQLLHELVELTKLQSAEPPLGKGADGRVEGSWTTTPGSPRALIYRGPTPRMFHIYSIPMAVEDSVFDVLVDGVVVGALIEGSGIVVRGKTIEVHRTHASTGEATIGRWVTNNTLASCPWKTFRPLSDRALPVALDTPHELSVTLHNQSASTPRSVCHLRVDGDVLVDETGSPVRVMSGTTTLVVGRRVEIVVIETGDDTNLGVVHFWPTG